MLIYFPFRETSYYNSNHLLPDETRIRISDEKFEALELLFNPSLIGKEYDGIPYMMMKSINSYPIDSRKELYNGIVLSGQISYFQALLLGLKMKLKKYIKKLRFICYKKLYNIK